MIIDNTENGDLDYDNPLKQGVVIYPENEKELKFLNWLMKEESIEEFRKLLEETSKYETYD